MPSNNYSQKSDQRPISFLLENSLSGAAALTYYRFTIRPEDLSRTEPSRLSTVQTLGGAYADNFGEGLRSIQISGHTGWMRDANAGGADGMTAFENLNSLVFKQWHQLRADAIAQGLNPDEKVKLIFSDKLDNICSVVAPQSFVLRRNKNRPLLMQYQISLAVLENDVSKQYASQTGSTKQAAAEGLKDVAGRISTASSSMSSLVGGSLGGSLKGFMDLTSDVLGKVNSLSGSVLGAGAQVVSMARDLTKAGTNIFRALAVAASTPVKAVSQLMECAGMFWNAYCLVGKMFRGMMAPNYSAFFGASTCSSTRGGKSMTPLRNVNALYAVGKAAAVVSVGAMAANILGSSVGGFNSLGKTVSMAGKSEIEKVTAAIPGLSATKDISSTLTADASSALSALTGADPVALLKSGGISGFVSSFGDRIPKVVNGSSVTVAEVAGTSNDTFTGGLSYSGDGA